MKNTNICITQATLKDRQLHNFWNDVSPAPDTDTFPEIATDPSVDAHLFACRFDGESMPLALINFTSSKYLHRVSIIVNPECRGFGLGTRCLRAALETLHPADTGKPIMGLVRNGDHAARKIAENAGFKRFHTSNTMTLFVI